MAILPGPCAQLLLTRMNVMHLAHAAAQVVEQVESAARGNPLSPALQARLLFAKSWVTGGEFAFEESLRHLEEARALVSGADDSQAPWRDKILFGLADNYALLGRNAESEALYRELYVDQVRRLGEAHARPACTLVGVGRALTNQGRLDEAAKILVHAISRREASLGPAHRTSLTARESLAMVRSRPTRVRPCTGRALLRGYRTTDPSGRSTTNVVH